MATVERDLGRKLEWAAVNHYDTGHPHAHLVVRGVIARGGGSPSADASSSAMRVPLAPRTPSSRTASASYCCAPPPPCAPRTARRSRSRATPEVGCSYGRNPTRISARCAEAHWRGQRVRSASDFWRVREAPGAGGVLITPIGRPTSSCRAGTPTPTMLVSGRKTGRGEDVPSSRYKRAAA